MPQLLKYRQPVKWEWSNSVKTKESVNINLVGLLILKVTAILKLAAVYIFLAPLGLIFFIIVNLMYRRQIVSFVEKY